ncbi:hypothetical protein RB594_004479 [Gaeumannomyces avenae]
MASPMQIPGYYYDEEKRKYFKIERNATAPASAAWSDRNVRKRKADAADAAAARRAAAVAATRVRRAPALADPVVGGLLRRELGGGGDGDGDAPQVAWARSMQDKGAVAFPGRIEGFVAVGEEDRLGLGLLYAVCSDPIRGPNLPRRDLPVYSNYFYRDEYDHIQTGPDVNPTLSRFCARQKEDLFRLKDISTITWDPATESIVLTSSAGAHSSTMVRRLRLNRHDDDGGDDTPTWPPNRPAGFSDHVGKLPPVWACAVAPPASSAGPYLALGTDRGVLVMHDHAATDGRRSTVTGISAPPRRGSAAPANVVPGGEVFALDFVGGHPHVLACGGRGPAGVCVADLREGRERRRGAFAAAEGGICEARVDVVAGGPLRSVVTSFSAAAAAAGRRSRTLYSDGSVVLPQNGKEPQTALLCHPGHGGDARYAGLVFPEGVAGAVPYGSGRAGGGGGGDYKSVRWLQAAREPVVNHVVSLNRHQLLTAGIEGRMHVWDLRRPGGVPYTTFPAFKNTATVGGLGLAVEKTLGVVAAANDDGSVRLHSLRSGLPLPSPALDGAFPAPSSSSSSSSSSALPCPRLQWAELPGDRAPSLFAARGAAVCKFSSGVDSRLRGDEFSE